jgi:hypothetical protein
MNISVKRTKNEEWIGYVSIGNVNLYAFVGPFEIVMEKIKYKANGLL